MNQKTLEICADLRRKIELGYRYSMATTAERVAIERETGKNRHNLSYLKKKRFMLEDVLTYLESQTDKDIKRMNVIYSTDLQAKKYEIYGTYLATAWALANKCFITEKSRARRRNLRLKGKEGYFNDNT